MTRGADWADRVGDVWAEEWRRTDRTFAGLAPHLDAAIDATAPAGAGTVLDVGCGAGITSLSLARRRPDLAVTGIDISERLVVVARERAVAERLANLTFVAGDAAAPPPLAPPDLLVSRHGVMFFDDPVAAFAALRSVAAPAAKLVFSCFRAARANPWTSALVEAITGAPPPPLVGYAPSPFAFADVDFVRGVLAAAGWRDVAATKVDYDYLAGEGDDPVADAVRTFGLIGPFAAMLAAADPATRPALLDRLRIALGDWRTEGRVVLPAAAWIWSAHA